MSVLEFFRDIAALSASVAVLYGINAWRRDFVGKRQIEIAEEALSLFYQARDAIQAIRSPFGYTSESSHVEKHEYESKATFSARQTVAPLYKRHEMHSKTLSELASLRYRFMARFGGEAEKPFSDLNAILHEVFLAADMYVMTADDEPEPDDNQTKAEYRESRRAYRAKFWSAGKDDPIDIRLHAIIANVERICGAHIGPRSLISLCAKKWRNWFHSKQGVKRIYKWLDS